MTRRWPAFRMTKKRGLPALQDREAALRKVLLAPRPAPSLTPPPQVATAPMKRSGRARCRGATQGGGRPQQGEQGGGVGGGGRGEG